LPPGAAPGEGSPRSRRASSISSASLPVSDRDGGSLKAGWVAGAVPDLSAACGTGLVAAGGSPAVICRTAPEPRCRDRGLLRVTGGEVGYGGVK